MMINYEGLLIEAAGLERGDFVIQITEPNTHATNRPGDLVSVALR